MLLHAPRSGFGPPLQLALSRSPGNIGQYTGHIDAFRLDTDTKRAVRLVFQPVLVAWALASTDTVQVFRERRALAR